MLLSILAGLLGALSNRIRGGLLDDRVRFNFPGKAFNAVTFGLLCWAVTGEWVVGLCAMAGMWLGSAEGWGSYIGALGGWEDGPLFENVYIERPIRFLLPKWNPLTNQYETLLKLRLWGFAAMTIRGLWWGVCIAVALSAGMYLAGNELQVVWSPVLAGAMFGLVYLACIEWCREFLDDERMGWPTAEWWFGAVLWSISVAGL